MSQFAIPALRARLALQLPLVETNVPNIVVSKCVGYSEKNGCCGAEIKVDRYIKRPFCSDCINKHINHKPTQDIIYKVQYNMNKNNQTVFLKCNTCKKFCTVLSKFQDTPQCMICRKSKLIEQKPIEQKPSQIIDQSKCELVKIGSVSMMCELNESVKLVSKYSKYDYIQNSQTGYLGPHLVQVKFADIYDDCFYDILSLTFKQTHSEDLLMMSQYFHHNSMILGLYDDCLFQLTHDQFEFLKENQIPITYWNQTSKGQMNFCVYEFEQPSRPTPKHMTPTSQKVEHMYDSLLNELFRYIHLRNIIHSGNQIPIGCYLNEIKWIQQSTKVDIKHPTQQIEFQPIQKSVSIQRQQPVFCNQQLKLSNGFVSKFKPQDAQIIQQVQDVQLPLMKSIDLENMMIQLCDDLIYNKEFECSSFVSYIKNENRMIVMGRCNQQYFSLTDDEFDQLLDHQIPVSLCFYDLEKVDEFKTIKYINHPRILVYDFIGDMNEQSEMYNKIMSYFKEETK